MDWTLDAVEVRVLGCLIEKEIATPEYYPLTLNALVNACNQKSNREPMVAYDEDVVDAALEGLRQKHLAATITGMGMRVPKHRELFSEALNLGRRETALMCVLMLRGAQTSGELRDRAGRLHDFTDLEEVESVLEHLAGRELVVRLPRQPGFKEPRWAHLVGGPVDISAAAPAPPQVAASPGADRLGALEAQMLEVREELEDLRRQFADFRRQFE